MKIQLTFAVLAFLIFSCGEKEEPQTIYGEYLAQSIKVDKAIDVTGEGIVSTDLLNQFRNGREFYDKTTGIIFLYLYTPEYFNVDFSQVVFRLPYQLETEQKVAIEYHQDGRRFDFEENGSLSLSWNTYPQPFEFPEKFHEDLVIESLKSIPGKSSSLELIANQRLFDHSANDWVEVKISYTFLKEN